MDYLQAYADVVTGSSCESGSVSVTSDGQEESNAQAKGEEEDKNVEKTEEESEDKKNDAIETDSRTPADGEENKADASEPDDDKKSTFSWHGEEDCPVCVSCGHNSFLYKEKCKGCGLITFRADLDDVLSVSSVYTSEDDSVQSWVAVDRKPRIPEKKNIGDMKPKRQISPAGSVELVIMMPGTLNPEKEQKRDDNPQEEEMQLDEEEDETVATPQQLAQWALERRIGERLEAMGRKTPEEIAQEEREKERIRLEQKQKEEDERRKWEEDIAQRPYIREPDTDDEGNKDEGNEDNDKSESDGEVPMDEEEQKLYNEKKKYLAAVKEKNAREKAKKDKRTKQTKRTKKQQEEKERIDYKQHCLSLQPREVELEDDGYGGKKLSEYHNSLGVDHSVESIVYIKVTYWPLYVYVLHFVPLLESAINVHFSIMEQSTTCTDVLTKCYVELNDVDKDALKKELRNRRRRAKTRKEATVTVTLGSETTTTESGQGRCGRSGSESDVDEYERWVKRDVSDLDVSCVMIYFNLS